MSLKKISLACFLGLCAALAQGLEFRDGYVRGLPPSQRTTAAFFSVRNDGQQPWEIVGVASEAAGKVEIHEHLQQRGMMQMREVELLTVPPGGELKFVPGGYHLMLIGLVKPLAEGETVQLTFTAADGATETVRFPVVSVVNEHRHHH